MYTQRKIKCIYKDFHYDIFYEKFEYRRVAVELTKNNSEKERKQVQYYKYKNKIYSHEYEKNSVETKK